MGNKKAKNKFSCGTRFEKVIKNLARTKTVFWPLERNGGPNRKIHTNENILEGGSDIRW